jgi:hypothetical protein
MQSLDLLMHLLEGDIHSSLAEVLAIEVAHEVSDDGCIVIHSVIPRRSEPTIPIRSEVYIPATILPSPIRLQFISILDYPSVSLHPIIVYL